MFASRRNVLSGLGALLSLSCSNGTTERGIQGQLNVAQFQLDGAQVFAVSSSGQRFRAPVEVGGQFALTVPTGSTYTLRFANATSSPAVYDAFAVLALMRADGTRTHWFTLTPGGTIDLGVVAKVGTLGTRQAGTRRYDDDEDAAGEEEDDAEDDEDGEDDDSDSDGESETVEDDDAEVCDLSDGADLEEVESEKDLLDEVDSDDDGEVDSTDDSDSDSDSDSDGDSDSDCDEDSDSDSEGEDDDADDDEDAEADDGDTDSDGDEGEGSCEAAIDDFCGTPVGEKVDTSPGASTDPIIP